MPDVRFFRLTLDGLDVRSEQVEFLCSCERIPLMFSVYIAGEDST